MKALKKQEKQKKEKQKKQKKKAEPSKELNGISLCWSKTKYIGFINEYQLLVVKGQFTGWLVSEDI
jgi:hypothetical protein